MQSFFGFGQSADIDIIVDGRETRKYAEIKAEDGRKEKHLLYYDGESVSGKVSYFLFDFLLIYYVHDIFVNNILFLICYSNR